MRKAIFTGVKRQGKLRLDNPELYESYSQSVQEGECFQMTVENIPKPKSIQQTKMHWGLLIDKLVLRCSEIGIDTSYIFNLSQTTGTAITKEQLHEYFYAMFPTHNKHGKIITMSSNEWTSENQHRLDESIMNYAASQWGVVLEPNPNWRNE